MPLTFEYDELTTVADDDAVIAVDVSDATHNEAGTTKYATRAALFGGPRTPTAAELSVGDALQEYFDECIATYGYCQLPPGTITGHLFIDNPGAILRGCGAPYGDRKTGTVIVPSDIEVPVITVREAIHVQLESFGIQDADLGISLEAGPSNLVFQNIYRDLAFANVELAVRVSEPPGTRTGQNAAADLVLSHCIFTQCDICVEMNHTQSLNIHLIDQCFLYSCGTAVWINNGGRVLISGCSCNGLGTWFRMLVSGGNLVPCVLDNTYNDRTGGVDAPIILDARGCTAATRFLVSGAFTSPWISGVDPPYDEVTHRFFYGPDGSQYAIDNSNITIADPDFFLAPGITDPYYEAP